MKVFKFGGTSVGAPPAIQTVIRIVKKAVEDDRIIVVVSAFGGVTDQLIEAGKRAERGNEQYREIVNALEKRHFDAVKTLIDVKRQSSVIARVKMLFNELNDILHGVFLVKELSPKTLDYVMSFGERISSYIITESFKNQKADATLADAATLIKTDKNFGNAHVFLDETYDNIRRHYHATQGLIIYPGFIGSTHDNEITTLGRGGSDYTASLVAAALGAAELQIWTDVDGVMTIDPRKVSKAFPIKRLSYAEAMEMSHFGAKVIYPPTIQPVFSKNIPLWIKNTFNPEAEGSLISKKTSDTGTPIKGISSIDKISLCTLHGSGMIGVAGISMRLFTALAHNNVNVILISQASSEHSISFAVAPQDALKAKAAVEKEFHFEIRQKQIEKVEVEDDLSIVAIVGENMKKTRGIAGKLFSTLGRNGINVVAIAQGSSELNISFVIENRELRKALNAIHDSFFLSETRDINVFLMGAGNVGNMLLTQIQQHMKHLAGEHGINLKIAGLANTRKMLFKEEGISISGYKNELEKQGGKSNIYKFIDKMIALNLPSSVFVDCTASADIAACYKKVLNASISIVTPNKVACSGKYSEYKELKEIALRKGVRFLFETNVGAGLPVISTLNDLIKSGDRIHKVEAILSGTLNYIFNTYSKEVPFSIAVKQAMQKGLSEPDPRIDLNGTDVSRKIVILARESGAKIEPEEVRNENFLPEKCQKAKTIDAFLRELENYDDEFEKQRAELDKQNKKLRYVATYEKGKAFTRLMEFDMSHPFYWIQGKDNIVLYHTERYAEQPLVVRGAGAGAEVTAAGVFADII
ncbi:MAG TPA: bifunctional aspartate kinase/homoserine dehydrogenase I, partial [Chitinophagales bacterium]|nr:bifunctional aspartate kinase/homoserine dehydrogenase I [Chitinophagales bacterium]